MKRFYLGITILLGLALLLFLIFRSSAKFWSKEIYKVQKKPIKILVYASCYLRPKDFVVLKTEVSGRVQKVFVKEGDLVRTGELLAVIEPIGLVERIEELRAKLNLVEERLAPHSSYLEVLRKNLEKAQTDFRHAESKYLRRKELFQAGLIAKEELEEAERGYQLAQKAVEQADSTLRDAIFSLQTEKKALLQQIKALRNEYRQYLVRSPLEGRVYNKYVEVGDFVTPTFGKSELFSVGSKDVEVWLEIDEEYASLVRPGQKIYLSFDALPHRVITGEVYQTIPEIDRNKLVFKAKAKVVEAIPELPAQATCEANILVKERLALVLPKKALQQTYVESKKRGKIQVKIGETFGEYVEVLSGLAEGEEVFIPK